MNIAILGSSGFIGSHLRSHFTRVGHTVFCCDVRPNDRSANYVVVDSLQPDYDSFFALVKFDVVINCSGAASVPASIDDPMNDFNLNVRNVQLMLEALRKFNPECRFINISSAAVYGNPQRLPVRESDILNPISPYGFHKCMAELLCMEYHRVYGIPTLSLRIFSAYGNGLKKQLLWEVSQKMLHSKNLELFGTGDETRDFIHIHDIIKQIELIVFHGLFHGEVYNVANGVQVHVKTIVNYLSDAMNYIGTVNYNGRVRAGDPSKWEADISTIAGLGYKQSISLYDGINDFVQWLNSNSNSNSNSND